MTKRTSWCVVLTLVAATAVCWEWPVADPVITATFGQPAGDSFLRGIELTGSDLQVHPVAAGTVIHVSRVGDSRSYVPDGTREGLGNYVVVEHDQGFVTFYAHLAPEPLPSVGQQVDRTSTIGVVGSSGAVLSRTLSFYVYDLLRLNHVNPLLLLPDFTDSIRPRIDVLYARVGDQIIDLEQEGALLPGRYQLIANIYDAWVRGGDHVAPYAVTLYVDGRERFSVTMERVTLVDGVSRIDPATRSSFEELYTPDGLMRLGGVDFDEGTTQIELVVTDFAGNESAMSIEVTAENPTDEDVQQEPDGE